MSNLVIVVLCGLLCCGGIFVAVLLVELIRAARQADDGEWYCPED